MRGCFLEVEAILGLPEGGDRVMLRNYDLDIV
jgi:hypothetical protein